MKVPTNSIKRAVKTILLDKLDQHLALKRQGELSTIVSLYKEFIESIPLRKEMTDDHTFKGLFIDLEERFFDGVAGANSWEKEKAKNLGIAQKTVSDLMQGTSKEKFRDAINIFTPFIDEVLEDQDFVVDINFKFEDESEFYLNSKDFFSFLLAVSTWSSAIKGSAASSFGKQIETPIMLALCKIYHVDKSNYYQYDKTDEGDFTRETDFYLIDMHGKDLKCEVKDTGYGNPEAADSAWRPDIKVYVATIISRTMKSNLTSNGVHYLELRESGWQKFGEILDELDIPNSFDENWKENIDDYLDEIFA